jgi:hypothetical protein
MGIEVKKKLSAISRSTVKGRSRHCNDNCFIKQKNGDAVRKTVGYARFQGDDVLPALENGYSCLNPLINCFYPAKKLIAKDRLPNGKIKKVCNYTLAYTQVKF